MDYKQAIMQRLMQSQQGGKGTPLQAPTNPQASSGNPMDPRGMLGMLSRGANVYNAGSLAAQQGGPNIGRPAGSMQQAAIRRLGV